MMPLGAAVIGRSFFSVTVWGAWSVAMQSIVLLRQSELMRRRLSMNVKSLLLRLTNQGNALLRADVLDLDASPGLLRKLKVPVNK